MKKILLILTIFTLITSCVSKVIRPKMTGTIVDENGKAVDSCLVGGIYTDKTGKFTLAEITHTGFVSLFGSGPIFISERISKHGYEPKELIGGNRRGGISKGTVWDMDTIRVRKNISDFSKINISDMWLASMTKDLDTVFMTKKNQEYDRSKVDYIANKQDTYARGYYFVGIDNLPENVFERHIELDLRSPIVKVQRVLIYGDTKTADKTKYDTITTTGKWKLGNKKLEVHTNLPEINGIYNVVEFNYDSMKLVKQ